MRRSNELVRYIVIGAGFIILSIVYVLMFINLQISGQDYYSMATPSGQYTRTEKIQAHRGEIYDRNGNKLVANEYTYDIRLDYGSMSRVSAERNHVLIALIDAVESMGQGDKIVLYKYTPFDVTVQAGGLSFRYNEEFFGLMRAAKYRTLAKDLNIKEDATADEAAAVLMKRYALVDADGALVYSPELTARLFCYRLDFDIVDFSLSNPYTFAKDISTELIAFVEEADVRGFTVFCNYTRKYLYPGYASHILGRIGKISAGKVDYYTELGYPLDATVGTSGVEFAFEKYLHGVDGEITITEDSSGNIIKTEVTKAPEAGQDVYLTIDIDMQIVSENALHDNILFVKQEAAYNDGDQDGEDAEAGALTAVDPDTGEVLVLASYPTYDLSTFLQDITYLNEDETSPLVNRALDGIYQPGSTFKPGVAVAAMDAGIISPGTYIETKGKYDFYEGYQPRCWIYLMYNQTHGSIDVTEAIQESCNYFFYEVGRLLTIETLDEYMKGFGLGEPTGIELSEKTGVLAGPDYRNENGLNSWNPGDTLQAAIGQSDHLFSPLQISMYVSTLVNDGVRYSAHVLKEVRPFGQSEPTVKKEAEILNSMDVSADYCAVVRNAMKDVVENGSASEMFEDYPITIGGKTGTAQVSKAKSDNAIFTSFAPFDSPELVVTCVIEQGNTGSNAGFAVKKLFDYYFSVGDYAEEEEDEEDKTDDAEDETLEESGEGEGDGTEEENA